MARKIAFYSFVTLVVSMLIGAYVLKVFGISMPVLRVAGGIVIALSAWKMLTADDEGEKQKAALRTRAGARPRHGLLPAYDAGDDRAGTISSRLRWDRQRPTPVLFALEAFATAALSAFSSTGFTRGRAGWRRR